MHRLKKNEIAKILNLNFVQKTDLILFEINIDEIFKFKKSMSEKIVEKMSTIKKRRYASIFKKIVVVEKISKTTNDTNTKKTKNVNENEKKNEKQNDDDITINKMKISQKKRVSVVK